MNTKVSIDGMASEVTKQMEEYNRLTSQSVKNAVTKAGQLVRSRISETAPKGSTGKYRKSWAVQTLLETSQKREITVYSRNRYQLAHLLEFGHAKRNGGRTSAQPHIAPAEQEGVALLEEEIKRSLSDG